MANTSPSTVHMVYGCPLTWLMITGPEWPLGCTLNVGAKVLDSGESKSNNGGDPTKLAAVGGGKNVFSEMKKKEKLKLIF